MRLIFIFISFLTVEYLLRTFIDPFKFHMLRPSLDFLPIILLTIASAIYYKDKISHRPFGWTFLSLFSTSVAGLIVCKTILFFQWYWIIAPEYRDVPGDISEGLGLDIANLIVGSIVVAFFYLVSCLTLKLISKKSVSTGPTD